MIFIPLGLSARIRDFPWFSTFVIMATVFLYIVRVDHHHDYSKYQLNLPEHQDTQWKLRSLKIAECKSSPLTESECQLLKKSALEDKPQNLIQYLGLLSRLYKTDDLNADEKKESLTRMIKYLTDPDLPPSLTSSKSESYLSAKSKSDALLKSFQEKHMILTGENSAPLALAIAQFSHSGWVHLLGNMLVLLGFVVFVEQYLGFAKTMSIYFVGGTVGLFLHLLTMNQEHTPLLGASANVFAIGGAFLTLFWRQKIEVLASAFFMLNKRIHVPVWAYFLAFVILNEIAGSIRPEESNVAHFAHLGGFATGVAMALFMTRTRPVPEHFIFPYEADEYDAFTKATSYKERRKILLNMLFHNPGNGFALSNLAAEMTNDGTAWSHYPPQASLLIRDSLHLHINELIDAQKWDALADLVMLMPRTWPKSELIPELSEYRRFKLQQSIANYERRDELTPLFIAKGA